MPWRRPEQRPKCGRGRRCSDGGQGVLLGSTGFHEHAETTLKRDLRPAGKRTGRGWARRRVVEENPPSASGNLRARRPVSCRRNSSEQLYSRVSCTLPICHDRDVAPRQWVSGLAGCADLGSATCTSFADHPLRSSDETSRASSVVTTIRTRPEQKSYSDASVTSDGYVTDGVIRAVGNDMISTFYAYILDGVQPGPASG